MSVLPVESYPLALSEPTQRHDLYVIREFTEASDPEAALRSQQIHAEGYFSMDFVTRDALTDDPPFGVLKPGMDKSQGPNTDYIIGESRENPIEDAATMRIKRLTDGETYESHPAFQMCESSLWLPGRAKLGELASNGAQIVEIGAMARTKKADPRATLEVIRDGIQNAIGPEDEPEEVWLFSIVSGTFKSLQRSLGEANLEQIGEAVAIPDDRVNPDITLVPALFRPNKFIDTLHGAYLDAEELYEEARTSAVLDSKQIAHIRLDAKVLGRSLLFYADGLDVSRISPAAFATYTELMETA